MDGFLSFSTISAYIFLAIILLFLGFMAAYLLVFFCFECKPSSDSSVENEGNKEVVEQIASSVTNADHMIVVIMAGDNAPTYLATPTPSPSRHTEEV